MRLAVFGDVHGNLPAFERMLDHAGRVDGYICIGDIVGYGPWADECVDLMQSLPDSVYIRGNHEEDFVAGLYAGQHPVAQAFFDHCRPRFDRIAAISDLSAEHWLGGIRFVHTIDGRNIYADTQVSLHCDHVIGHSHHQYSRTVGDFRLLNTGSVGQNRGFINIINYLLYDTNADQFELRALPYDVDIVIAEMVATRYPDECVEYYRTKPRG